jgi:hypothetical protein
MKALLIIFSVRVEDKRPLIARLLRLGLVWEAI